MGARLCLTGLIVSTASIGCHRALERTTTPGPLSGFQISEVNVRCPGEPFELTSEKGPMPPKTLVALVPINGSGEYKAIVTPSAEGLKCAFPPNAPSGTYTVVIDEDTHHERDAATVYLEDSLCK